MTHVTIDGVRYIPQAEAVGASPLGEALLDALVEQWGGSNWRRDYGDAPEFLRVVVDDSLGADEGESVIDFVARIVEKAAR